MLTSGWSPHCVKRCLPVVRAHERCSTRLHGILEWPNRDEHVTFPMFPPRGILPEVQLVQGPIVDVRRKSFDGLVRGRLGRVALGFLFVTNVVCTTE